MGYDDAPNQCYLQQLGMSSSSHSKKAPLFQVSCLVLLGLMTLRPCTMVDGWHGYSG